VISFRGWSMRRTVLTILGLVLLVCSCTSYSLREESIRSGVPETYKTWSGGIRTQLTEQEVNEAISLGQSSKENADVLEYAYIYKPGSLEWYIRVRTPMYLVGQNALKQAREYRPIDTGFVEYCRSLDVAAIDVNEQALRNDLSVRVRRYEIILLRDGIRVEPVTDFPTYNGKNPFVVVDPKLKIIIKDSQKRAEALMANLTPEQRAMVQNVKTPSSLSAFSLNVFRVDDLVRPGVYEVIVRTPKTSNLLLPGDKEIRFTVDFSRFK